MGAQRIRKGASMAIWDVTRLPAADQFDYWHEVICRAFVPLIPVRDRSDAGFAARVETRAAPA